MAPTPPTCSAAAARSGLIAVGIAVGHLRRGAEGKSGACLSFRRSQALFEPEARKIPQRVNGIASMIKAHALDCRLLIGKGQLLQLQLVMVFPLTHELFQKRAVSYTDPRTLWVCFFIRNGIACVHGSVSFLKRSRIHLSWLFQLELLGSSASRGPILRNSQIRAGGIEGD